MIQPIVLYSKAHNILNTPVKQVTTEEDREATTTLIQDLKDTLESVGGLGLAANQIGRNLSVCVCKINDNVFTMINPVITNASDEMELSEEGCLSLPDVVVKIQRHNNIEVSFVNPDSNWEYETMKFDFPNSVIPQHEIDHLNGRIMIDYLTPLQITLLGNKLKRISRGNVSINYVGMVWRDNKKSWNLIGSYLKLAEFYSYQNKIMQDKLNQLNINSEITGSTDNSVTIGDNNVTEESNSSEENQFEPEENTSR
jgi:peptide deformylase